MGSRVSVDFKDEYLVQGAKEAAKEQGKTFSEYLAGLVAEDVKKRQGYRIVVHCTNGAIHEENDFYTEDDIYESAHAFVMMDLQEIPMYDGSYVTMVELYKHDTLIERYGEIYSSPEKPES